MTRSAAALSRAESARPAAATAEGYAPPWFASFAAVAMLVVGAAVAQALLVGPALLRGATLSMHISVGAAWLLAVATALYLVLGAAGQALGLWASRLALAGAAGLLGGSALRAIESEWLWPQSPIGFVGDLELPSWIAALAVLAYLRIEQVWRTRSAGAMVLSLVLGALLLDVWLMSQAPHMPAALVQVMDTHLGGLWHIGGKLGVAACVALALWCVGGNALPVRVVAAGGAWLSAAMSVGLAGFTLAMLSALALLVMTGAAADAVQRALAGVAVWVNFLVLYCVWRTEQGRSGMLTWWIALALGFALLGYAGLDLLERIV